MKEKALCFSLAYSWKKTKRCILFPRLLTFCSIINYLWQRSVNIKVVLKKQSRREMAFWEGCKKKCRDLQWPCDILYSRCYSVAGITPGWVIISVSPNGYASWNVACLMNYPPSSDFSVSSAAGCRCCVERDQMFSSVVFLVDSVSRAPSWIGHDEVSVVFLKNCSETKAVSAKFHHQSEEIMEFTCWAATSDTWTSQNQALTASYRLSLCRRSSRCFFSFFFFVACEISWGVNKHFYLVYRQLESGRIWGLITHIWRHNTVKSDDSRRVPPLSAQLSLTRPEQRFFEISALLYWWLETIWLYFWAVGILGM